MLVRNKNSKSRTTKNIKFYGVAPVKADI
jgi:hypothetical protein